MLGVLALSATTSTTAAISRSVTTISSVLGKWRCTDTSATHESRTTLSAMAPASTFSRVVPWGTAASTAISSPVRWSAPVTSTFSMVKADEKYSPA